MRYLILLLLFFLACGGDDSASSPGIPDRNLGVMWLSATNDQSCEWLEIFEGVEPINLSFLYPSFGKDFSCLREIFSWGVETNLRVYLSNGICKRKSNCSDLEPRNLGEVINAFLEIERVVLDCPHCTLQIAPQLEDNFSHAEACQYAAALQGLMSYEIIRSPVTIESVDDNDPCFDGIELHNEDPRGSQRPGYYSGSNDGKSILLPSEYAFSGLHISIPGASRFRDEIGAPGRFYIWHALGNCLHRDTAQEVFPHLRNCDTRPDIYHDLNQLLKRGL